MSQYELYYHPEAPVWHFTSGMHHDEKVQFINDVAVPELRANNFEPIHQDLLANMVRLNWMCDNVKWQPLVKPIVATETDNDDWMVIVGDTRLAAFEINGLVRIRAILQSKTIPDEPGWLHIKDLACLAIVAGCEPDQVLGAENYKTQPFEWIEFASQSSKDHMHDADQRFRMISNYLKQQPVTFQFNTFWFQELVDWKQYDY